jgi:hypothetical protein
MELNFFHCSQDGRKINAAAAEFHELKGIFCLGRIRRNVADVLQVKEQKAVVILFNGLGRVAFARDQVGGIELKPDVLSIGVFENQLQIRRTLAESIEVIVVAERDADIGSSFTLFSE